MKNEHAFNIHVRCGIIQVDYDYYKCLSGDNGCMFT